MNNAPGTMKRQRNCNKKVPGNNEKSEQGGMKLQ
jgi:hypothetical protein